MTTDKLNISIIGAGRLGGALAIALARHTNNSGGNYHIVNIVSRSEMSALRIAQNIEPEPQPLSAKQFHKLQPADVFFIATPDSEIQPTADNLSGLFNFKQQNVTFLHTSGSLSSNCLKSLRDLGARTGSFHPLVAISDAKIGAERLRGAFYCIEGDEEAIKTAQEIVRDLDGVSFTVETEKKTLYHAAAVLAAGHLVALFDIALELLTKCGLSESDAHKILLPLVQSAVDNLSLQKPSAALTGTFARADISTMKRHLQALKQQAAQNVATQAEATEEALRIYAELGKRSIKLAAEQNADQEILKQMLRCLEQTLKGDG